MLGWERERKIIRAASLGWEFSRAEVALSSTRNRDSWGEKKERSPKNLMVPLECLVPHGAHIHSNKGWKMIFCLPIPIPGGQLTLAP